MLVDFLDEIPVGKCIRYAFHQFGLVAGIIEQYRISLFSVTSGASGLLKIGFGRVGHIHMHNQSYVRFVDAHAEGVGGYHDSALVCLPQFLALVFFAVAQSGMIKGSGQSLFFQLCSQLLASFSAAAVYNHCSWYAADDMLQLGFLVFGVAHYISQVLSGKAHLEDIFFPEMQLILDILHDLGGSGGGERQHGSFGNYFPEICDFNIRRTEVIAPL